jgi:hypothetical protein
VKQLWNGQPADVSPERHPGARSRARQIGKTSTPQISIFKNVTTAFKCQDALAAAMLRRRSLWVVLAALLILSAGAVLAVQAFGGGARPIVLNEVESGALPHFAAAEQAAEAWDADAILLGVRATEGKPLEGRVDPPFLYDTSPDPLVGNGRAVAWTFSYAAPAQHGKLFHVTVGGDGALLYQRALAFPTFYGCCYAVAEPASSPSSSGDGVVVSSEPAHFAPPALSAPALDADEAFARVADHPAFANFSLDHPVFQAFLELGPGPEGRPVWGIGYRTATFYAVSAAVDATNGTVLHVSAWPSLEPPCCDPRPVPPTPPMPPPCCPAEDHHATYRATLGPSRASHTVNFPMDSPRYAREARVLVTLDSTLPLAGDAVLQVYDGDMRPLARVTGAGMLEVVLTGFPSMGVYHAEITLPAPLVDVAAEIAVDVLYDAQPHAAPAAYAFQGATYPWGAQTYLPMWFDEQARPTHLTLRWEPGPLEDLELVLVDQYGNEVATAGGAGEATLDVPEDEGCCMMVIVRNAVQGPAQVPFDLDVEVAPWSPEHDDGHYGHYH